MKNLKILILLSTFFLLFSCRDYKYDVNASIVGNWQPVKAKATTYVLGIAVSQTQDMNACQQQSRMIYNDDLSATEIRYDDATGTCEMTLKRDFKYIYNRATKSLLHTFQDGSTKPAEVILLTSSTLIVKGQKIIDGKTYDVEVTNVKVP